MDDSTSNAISILIVETDPRRRARLIACLSDEARFKIVGVGDDFLEVCALPFQQHMLIHVLLINIDQPAMDQVNIWAAIHSLLPNTQIVGLTAGYDDQILRLALGAGAMALHLLDAEADVLR